MQGFNQSGKVEHGKKLSASKAFLLLQKKLHRKIGEKIAFGHKPKSERIFQNSKQLCKKKSWDFLKATTFEPTAEDLQALQSDISSEEDSSNEH